MIDTRGAFERVRGFINSRSMLLKSLWQQKRNQPGSHLDHMKATAEWLAAAHDATPDGGVAALYSLRTGWDFSYPETTGYIIPTFLAYAKMVQKDEWVGRSVRMANWLLSLQLENGSWASRDNPFRGLVFDTGQVMLGLIAGCRSGWPEMYLNAVKKAGNWLVAIQEDDGSWIRGTYHSISTTYHARVAWALLEAAKELENIKMQDAAVKNLDWVMKQQMEDGWFSNAAFSTDEMPSLHTIAYTIRGLFESGLILENEAYLAAAKKAAFAVAKTQREDGQLAGEYSPGWGSHVPWCCLTGTAQMAIVWAKIYNITKEPEYLSAASKAVSYIKTTQMLQQQDNGSRGGIWGSFPISGGYLPYVLPNWAAKFFLDALMALEKIEKESLSEDDALNKGILWGVGG